MGADSSATFGTPRLPTIEQPCDKLVIVEGKMIIGGTGQVGLGQRFVEKVKDGWRDGFFKGSPVEAARKLASSTLQDFASTGIAGGHYGALLAFPVQDKMHLCEFATSDFQPELKVAPMRFCSMGSGQLIGDPFMALMREIFWDAEPPSLQDGIFATTWALDHAIKVNPGGVNGPVNIAVLEIKNGKPAARVLSGDELQEHFEFIAEAKDLLRGLRDTHRSGEAGIPDVPKPTP